MLNIGLIGNTAVLEPFANRIRGNKSANIIGKASIGTSTQLDSFHFSIPEYNKIELIERADVIVLDNSSQQSFKLISDIVRKSKHIFVAGYLNLTIDECTQLVKLANESGSIIQIINPYFFTPAMQWLSNHVSSPVFIDIVEFTKNGKNENLLYPIIMMLLEITGISPKKVGAVTFNSNPNKSDFTNIRLEFGDASVVNISYGTMEPLEEFKFRIYANNQFVTFNFTRETFVCNNAAIDVEQYANISEIDYFFSTINGKARKKSCIEDYLIAMYLAQKINRKITQFFEQ